MECVITSEYLEKARTVITAGRIAILELNIRKKTIEDTLRLTINRVVKLEADYIKEKEEFEKDANR